MDDNANNSKAVKEFQDLCIAIATGTHGDIDEYNRKRDAVLSIPLLRSRLPEFIITCRDVSQYWAFIKHQDSTYAGRRHYLWDAFNPLLSYLEQGAIEPTHLSMEAILTQIDSPHIADAWKQVFVRRDSDPEGAITSARSLLETVCKHIIDDMGGSYSENDKLLTLYNNTAKLLNLSPSQHKEQVFKQILSGCSSVVNGLASLRNAFGDAHGKGVEHVKPSSRHATLAVNLAGTISTFLLATYEQRHKKPSGA